jgi:hypothetical protein
VKGRALCWDFDVFFVKTSDALVATIHGVLRYAQNDEVKLSRLGALRR